MTREEAEKLIKRAWLRTATEVGAMEIHPGGQGRMIGCQEGDISIRPDALVDIFVAFGILQLDEPKPKTLYGKITDALMHLTDQSAPADVRLAFNRVGLDIVEK